MKKIAQFLENEKFLFLGAGVGLCLISAVLPDSATNASIIAGSSGLVACVLGLSGLSKSIYDTTKDIFTRNENTINNLTEQNKITAALIEGTEPNKLGEQNKETLLARKSRKKLKSGKKLKNRELKPQPE